MIINQRSHRMVKNNHASYLPRYLIAFDAETLPIPSDESGRHFSHRFRLATATRGRIVGTEATAIHRAQFSTVDQFWQWLKLNTASNYTTWIVSHNALFDMIVCGFMTRLENAELAIEWPRSNRTKANAAGLTNGSSASCVIESPPTIIAMRIVETGARIVIIDTLNWFPVALSQLGERLKLPKLDMPEFADRDERWFTYCQRDSDICFFAFAELFNFVRVNDLGMFRYTAPSQAMAAFRHRFMEHKIFVHDNLDVKQLERRAYFGGRTEVFKRGAIRETVYQLDVNSLFPSAMQTGSYPCVLDRYELRDSFLELLPSIDWSQSVASVVIDTPEPIYPIRTPNCVVYPTGRFSTTLCGVELDDAHRKGYIRKVGSWAEYRTERLFNKWVSELYALRLAYKENGDSVYEDFVKRLLNALSGKFGEKAPAWTNVYDNRSGLPWSTWIEFDSKTAEPIAYRMFGWQCQRKAEGVETLKSFVAISAFITATARQHMNRLRTWAGPGNVYYQGVDCLIVNQLGFDRLTECGEIHPTDLGKLKIVCTVDDAEIMGCADYRLGTKVVIAGRARKVERLEDGSLLQRKFHAANAIFNGRAATEIREDLSTWARTGIVTKGIERADGWIEPFQLQQCEQ